MPYTLSIWLISINAARTECGVNAAMTYSDPLQAALLSDRVPRYTSYPPASRFTQRVSEAAVLRWMDAMPDGAEVSLYVHVPFCRRLCYFCACRTQGTRSDAPLDSYLESLASEVAEVSLRLPKDVRIKALHLGGGTPTILSPERLFRLSNMLHQAFPITGDTQISAEIDPTDCDRPRLDALARMGLRRASLGVQDFEPIVQDAIGRHQSVSDTADCAADLRDRGVTSLNIDLLYGLPHQTEDSLNRTLDHVLEISPDRLALFGYAHVPWMARRQRVIPEEALPGAEDRVALNRLARQRLLDEGYVLVGMDHFAKANDSMATAAESGLLRRNFQGYTTDTAPYLIGLGPSAISEWPEGYSQNATSTGDWKARLMEQTLPAARGYALTEDDRVVKTVISDIMCKGQVNLAKVASDPATSDALVRQATTTIRHLPGIATLIGSVLKAERPEYLRLLAAAFDPTVEDEAERYSVAS